MSMYSELARAARQTELEESNEQLHADIRELETVLDAQAFDLKDADKAADLLQDRIDSAVDSLRLLTEVPLRDLEDSIEEIVKGLTA